MIGLAVHERNVLPDRAWDMTLPELCTLLHPPESQELEVSNNVEGFLVGALLDERIARIKALTLEERVELQEWKAYLM